ncbi:unnamed protein product [Lactuca saligna]|uniref:BHLH domain-containing protein n=1 Tax=Lactuca saligna TaxID=75948 RepID=A0AA35VQU5_LACSI|nr:unnamed protein product [Lactuca saligna]
MGYLLKEALKTLCGVNQWSYAIFWKIGCQNPKFLIWEECYYEPVIYSNVGHEDGGNKVHLLVTKMMKDNYINLLGEGLVGRVAFTRNHQWIISDNKLQLPGVHPPEVSNEVFTQFSAGIQTIAVIPVHPHGVVQLGSSSTIMENVGFVNDVKGLICQLGCVPGALLSENYMKREAPTDSLGSSGHSCFSFSRHIGDDHHNGLTLKSQQIEKIPCYDHEIGFGSLLGNYQPALRLMEQRILSEGDHHHHIHINHTPPHAHFSGKQMNGKLEHELFEALSMSSEEHLKPPSRDDLFDIVDAVVSKVPSSSKPITDDNINMGAGGINLMQRDLVGNGDTNSSIISSQISSWTDQTQDLGKTEYANNKSKRPDEIGKSNRKRLKPGQNPRPRPKDRQMIQDRVKELREIVPNGAKCSIDALLERTIKHMLFLQSVTKHADKLKQTGESKSKSKIASKEGQGGVLLRDNFEGGATWAYEVGSQSMVCPIIVEDLNSPRQMLVEMVCEERGSFLEIADVVRGLGLTILKGVMESRNDKIWAYFTVEANRDVSRMEIFISLVSLLDQSAKNGGPAASVGMGMNNLSGK